MSFTCASGHVVEGQNELWLSYRLFGSCDRDFVGCLAGLEGRKVSLQRRTSSITRKPSTLADLLPPLSEAKRQPGSLPAISQPQELSIPLSQATAAARSSQEVQQILM